MLLIGLVFHPIWFLMILIICFYECIYKKNFLFKKTIGLENTFLKKSNKSCF